MNIVVYCRVSSLDQVDGTSLEHQRTECANFAARNGWTIAREFIEEGESAKFANRTKLLELLSYCKEKTSHIGAMLVWKVDRFARNAHDHFMLKGLLKQSGVRLVSVTEPVDDESPIGKLMETMLAGISEFDNDVRSGRSIAGMRSLVQSGIFPWKPPLGYLAPKTGKKREPDRPDPERFDLLKRAWQRMATGAYTKAEILRLLRKWNVRNHRGGTLSSQTVDYFLSNAFYAGIIRNPWTGEDVVGRHQPMVSAEDFARVQMILAKRNHARPRHRAQEDFPLRGLVRCSSCSRPLTGGWSRGHAKRYAYYSCGNRACERGRKSLARSSVHAEFFDFLPALGLSRSITDAAIEALAAASVSHTSVFRQAAARNRETIGTLQRQVDEAVALRTSRLITDEEFTRQRDRIRAQILEAQASANMGSLKPLSREEAQELVRSLADLPTVWHELALVQKQAFGRVLFPVGYAVGEIRTAETGRLFRTNEPSEEDNPHLADLFKADPNATTADIRAFLDIVKDRVRVQKQVA